MPKKTRLQIKSISNVAASKTARIDLPANKRCHRVVLTHGYAAGTNTIAAAALNITEIRLFRNGRVQWRLSATDLRDRNLLNGTAYDFTGLPNTAPGVTMTLHFAEPWMQDEKDQDALALPIDPGGYYLEVDIGAASTPTLAASGIFDTSLSGSVAGGAQGWMNKIIKLSMPAGNTSFDYLAGAQLRGNFLRSMSVYPDSGGSNALTEFDVKVDNDPKHDLLTLSNTAVLLGSLMTPAASGRASNIYDAVFDHDGLLDSALDLTAAKEIILTVKAGSAMSGTSIALVEYFGPPD